jgi:hypothetical protein
MPNWEHFVNEPLMNPTTGLVLALLFAGHVVGDFLLQTRWIADRKARIGPLVVHLLLIGASHILFLLPFMEGRVVVVIAGVIVLHGLIDAVTGRIRAKVSSTRSLAVFAADQALHVIVLFVAWAVLAPDIMAPRWIPGDSIEAATAAAVLIAAYVFNWNGGSVLVRGVLALVRLTSDAGVGTAQHRDESRSTLLPGTGHLIGGLERLLTFTLVLLGEWSALGFILAAKSIARFKELEDREFSEYYLLGTLTSVIVATATGLLVRLLLIQG